MPENRSTDCTSSTSRGWASGRVLTAAQRERKRVKDRQTSSKRRNKLKNELQTFRNQIEDLTAQVEALKNDRNGELHKNGDLHVPEVEVDFALNSNTELDDLVDFHSGNDASTTENDPLAMTADSPRPIGVETSNDPLLSSTFSTVSPTTLIIDEISEICGNSSPAEDELSIDLDGMNLPQIDIQPAGFLRWTPESVSGATFEELEPATAQDVFNWALLKVRQLSYNMVCRNNRLNQDALLRGVLHGWDEVRARHAFFCPLWAVLRYLDKRMFCLSSMMTRFCTLYMIHQIMLCFVSRDNKPFNKLPAWYRPRPTQYSLMHAPAIDVLPWPGLRERAIHHPLLTETNEFWTKVIYDFRFQWPYAVTDAFDHNVDTGLFSLSGLFQSHVRDVRTWQMDWTFFERYPETYDDIVPVPKISRNLFASLQKQMTTAEEKQRLFAGEALLPLPPGPTSL